MRKRLSFILLLCLLAAGFQPKSAMGKEAQQGTPAKAEQETQEDSGHVAELKLDDAISRVKLKEESLPDGFEITSEVRATGAQIYKIREKIGFPLKALLNQKISYDGHQARLNYMSLPNESWVDFGYSRLMKDDGQKGMVMVKDGVLIQMIVSRRELEDPLILLLGIDQLQSHKIRFHQFPEDWTLESERFLTHDELRELELSSGGTIRQGLLQEIIVKRTDVTIMYFDCMTQGSADLVGRELAMGQNPIEKRIVKGYGSIVVSVDSTSADLNRQMFQHMHW